MWRELDWIPNPKASARVALKEDGSVIAWGDNSNGQVTVPEVARQGVTAIAAGHFYTLASLGPAIPLEQRIVNEPILLSWPNGLSGFKLQSTTRLDGECV